MSSFPLNNVTTADTYTEANTSRMDPPREAPAMVVTNNAVFYTVYVDDGLRASGGQPLPEAFAPQGRYAFSPSDFPPSGKCRGIAVRSGAAGFPAQVTIH